MASCANWVVRACAVEIGVERGKTLAELGHQAGEVATRSVSLAFLGVPAADVDGGHAHPDLHLDELGQHLELIAKRAARIHRPVQIVTAGVVRH